MRKTAGKWGNAGFGGFWVGVREKAGFVRVLDF